MKVMMMDLFLSEDYDEDEFGSLHDLGLTLSEDLNINNDDDMQYESRHDFGDISLSLAKDLVDEFLCIDMNSANPHNLDSIPVSDHLNTIQSKLSSDGGIECEVIDEETNNMLLLVSDDAKSVGFYASDCDSRPNNEGHGAHLARHPKERSKLRHIVPKKTCKVDWTPELHRSFVRAVEKLGVDNAIPSKILEIMGVRHLTRHNIASHLQKYRSHTKHVRAKKTSTSGSWNYHPKIQRQTAGSIHRPTCAVQQAHVVAPRPTQPIVVPTGLQYVWGCPSVDHLWPQSWQASAGSSVWPILVAHPATGGLECVDAWGHPVRPPFYPSPLLTFPIAPIPLGVANRVTPIVKTRAEKLVTSGLHSAKERVDAAIKEVLKDPFTPLPLGLKPPSIESVLSELQKRGIESMPISRLQSTN